MGWTKMQDAIKEMLPMLEGLPFTQARRGFAALYNDVYNKHRPRIIKRKRAEEVLVMRADLQKLLLADYSLKAKVLHEKDGSITIALDQLAMYANSETKEKAVKELIEDVELYAGDYIDRSELFLNTPNRRSHFPYIMRILLCENEAEIRGLLEV